MKRSLSPHIDCFRSFIGISVFRAIGASSKAFVQQRPKSLLLFIMRRNVYYLLRSYVHIRYLL